MPLKQRDKLTYGTISVTRGTPSATDEVDAVARLPLITDLGLSWQRKGLHKFHE